MKWDHVVVIYDDSFEGLLSYESFGTAAFEHMVCSEIDIQLEAFPFQLLPVEYDFLRNRFLNQTIDIDIESDFRWITSVYNDIDLKMRALLHQQTTSNGLSLVLIYSYFE